MFIILTHSESHNPTRFVRWHQARAPSAQPLHIHDTSRTIGPRTSPHQIPPAESRRRGRAPQVAHRGVRRRSRPPITRRGRPPRRLRRSHVLPAPRARGCGGLRRELGLSRRRAGAFAGGALSSARGTRPRGTRSRTRPRPGRLRRDDPRLQQRALAAAGAAAPATTKSQAVDAITRCQGTCLGGAVFAHALRHRAQPPATAATAPYA